MPVDISAMPVPSRPTPPVIWVSLVLRSTIPTRTVYLLQSRALRRAPFINFATWLPLSASGRAPRSACRPDPSRLHLKFLGAFEDEHASFRPDRLARHDHSLLAQRRSGGRR